MELLKSTLVKVVFVFSVFVGICDAKDRDKEINCYSCNTMSSILNASDYTCRSDLTNVPTCKGHECQVVRIEYSGDEMIIRDCMVRHKDGAMMTFLGPSFEKSVTRKFFGAKISWRSCDTELCNWGVAQRAQTLILFLSTVLPLSVYCYYF
ncbi:uncharacterized protein LOC124646260 [Helicoverpa zea]|uniref:uncharacterized protein LOC124646260 n=1 Tax=Helicoverpa zea TaxID=7113 RepID=UPI001F5917A0|nr:uncharacterized protein LOC124646260 [Helicoverpa zea]